MSVLFRGTLILVIGTAVYAAITNKLNNKLTSYLWQSSLLVAISFMGIFLFEKLNWILALGIMAAPLIRAFAIRPFMALTTVEPPPTKRAARSRWREFIDTSWAEPYWREYGTSRLGQISTIVAIALLTSLAYGTAFSLIPLASDTSDIKKIITHGLAASLSLLLIGFFSMLNEEDTSSHIMGLLVMENGMFLAAIVFLADTDFLFSFFIGLFMYVALTLFILSIFAPRLHRASKSAFIGDQTELREYK